MSNVWRHLKTVLEHKYYVCKYCWRIGLYWRGLVHDLSKFSPTEFIESVKYYDGSRSPIGVARQKQGYSRAWPHHFHHNKHHALYWADFYSNGKIIDVKVPTKYLKEMVVDTIAASITYNGDDFSWDKPLEYQKHHGTQMHPETRKAYLDLLSKFAQKGEDAFEDLRKFDYDN